MIRKLIPGALALGLIATTHAEPPAVKASTEAAAKVEATTPAVEVPAKPKLDPAVVRADSSYGLGYRTGGGFLQQFGQYGVSAADLEMVNFMKGFTTSINGGKPEVDEEKLQAAMQAFGEMLQGREKIAAAANLEAGKKFLAGNGKRKEVTTTKSGLQYEVITKGGEEKYVAPKDAKEGAEDKKQFLVHYKGTLIDGKQFDASPEGQTVPMTLQVVPGFKEALTTMPVGAKWKLFLPSELAYGKQRRSADIAPNSALIFELELVKIQDAPAAPEGGMPFPMPQGEPSGAPEGAPEGATSEPVSPPSDE
jgi:FKBP-type peptidyl-prolyl cis-trans isomerase